MDKRCNNCNGKHTGQHPYLCQECRQALQAKGVTARTDQPKARIPWWSASR